ncbi:hypothetical protein A2313_01420 [Candidatus Roizmanbacteria bacterium RIFOXYB2_FULL_41_10]|uniref:Methylated-DNA-[protein]-cysteine S-methyltransferase DNA binding domain-containing protein n=1 Tax=Candidatus Roizmanbacteria bacterium RIFOXYA1_FULL_41_12 TaxID=1802082 RepID=A0A1F7K947_9BACT|nr:MAG: hypothetical protein A2209_02640 [Candidatus Roizmanbacteria bacterium RIFOXYA1_FULL_41_12]OGK66361.1 MAG: hypothetical protein A2262_02690 [Candidatus Roizmanbacteria bacterium RIFOXYA2_FULL_41_8]OGK71033.1 MAG: hypothetical protein A2313_01420 [Candidatus Roizmanbacteria bacterium RIFOXYB2_FULL_41_10]OGK71328.1 MAG: hypothetical protein A2403_00890 [Candidatus Roizmanbacteria bacterium RIFOXYC1_FULL_41_16]OGK74406.1 MAG: hypothetical protein A2459_03510 [Candidatus Roizmanbacteria bac
MTILYSRILAILIQIPKGKVVTYKQVAELVGTSPRVVGNLIHRNPDPVKYPCHRVVKSDGSLASGYAFGGPVTQRRKLQKEGVIFHNNKIDLELYLYY